MDAQITELKALVARAKEVDVGKVVGSITVPVAVANAVLDAIQQAANERAALQDEHISAGEAFAQGLHQGKKESATLAEQVRVMREALRANSGCEGCKKSWPLGVGKYGMTVHIPPRPLFDGSTEVSCWSGPVVRTALALTPTEAEQRVTRLVAVEAAGTEVVGERWIGGHHLNDRIDDLAEALGMERAALGTGEVEA